MIEYADIKKPTHKGKVPVRRLSTSIITVSLVGALGLAACGSDDKADERKSEPTAAVETTLAPEDIKVDAATVRAGLTKLPATIAAAIAAIGTPDAETKLAAIEAEWASFEGTVRDTDSKIYIEIEDQLAPVQRQIEAGDAAAATQTATTLSGIFAKYLAKYP